MSIQDKSIILTGAAGGIGRELANLLAAEGARLCLTDINADAVQLLSAQLPGSIAIGADISDGADRQRLVDETLEAFSGIDILINAAGINPFGIFAQQNDAAIEATLKINTLGPMLLTKAVLPSMLARNSGQIVNIGSTFGSIGFAWFSAYSASKFALRGFSQSLRRELAETGIRVSYIAPRAVKTAINSEQVYAMAEATKMHMDEPAVVAREILNSIKQRRKERYLGFPESLFVRINAILPGLVDRATRKQNRDAQRFAAQAK